MSGGGEKGSGTTKTPADFLKSIRGLPVVVKLNSGVDYRGQFFFGPITLRCFRFAYGCFLNILCCFLQFYLSIYNDQ